MTYLTQGNLNPPVKNCYISVEEANPLQAAMSVFTQRITAPRGIWNKSNQAYIGS